MGEKKSRLCLSAIFACERETHTHREGCEVFSIFVFYLFIIFILVFLYTQWKSVSV